MWLGDRGPAPRRGFMISSRPSAASMESSRFVSREPSPNLRPMWEAAVASLSGSSAAGKSRARTGVDSDATFSGGGPAYAITVQRVPQSRLNSVSVQLMLDDQPRVHSSVVGFGCDFLSGLTAPPAAEPDPEPDAALPAAPPAAPPEPVPPPVAPPLPPPVCAKACPAPSAVAKANTISLRFIWNSLGSRLLLGGCRRAYETQAHCLGSDANLAEMRV